MKEQYFKGINSPVEADSVDSPIVVYGDGPAHIDFLANDEQTWWRVTFEKLDSLRVSRGEYPPVPENPEQQTRFKWVSIVENSAWLLERYEYERNHYGSSYDWGQDVREMVSEFSHYVLSFHDEFVEVLARGIWFDLVDDWSDGENPNHPLVDLDESATIEKRSAHGITYQIRRSPNPIDRICTDAELCSQILYQFAAELDGDATPSWSVYIRSRNGQVTSTLRGYFGKLSKTYEGVVGLEVIIPEIEEWLHGVMERQKEMGKM